MCVCFISMVRMFPYHNKHILRFVSACFTWVFIRQNFLISLYHVRKVLKIKGAPLLPTYEKKFLKSKAKQNKEPF